MSAVYRFLNSLDGKFDKAIGIPVRFCGQEFTDKLPLREGIIVNVKREKQKFSIKWLGDLRWFVKFRVTVLDSSGTKVEFSIVKGRTFNVRDFMRCYFV